MGFLHNVNAVSRIVSSFPEPAKHDVLAFKGIPIHRAYQQPGELTGVRASDFFPVTYVDVIESLGSVSSLAVARDA